MIIYMMSGPDGKLGFNEEMKNYLQKDLLGCKKLVAIALTPDSFDKNDSFMFGNPKKGYMGNKKMFQQVSNDIESFVLIDHRLSNEEAKSEISSADIILLLGGDAYVQREYFIELGLKDILSNFNGVLIGVSAGSMNMAFKPYYSADDDYPETKFYETSLSLVDISVDPHFEITEDNRVQENKIMSNEHSIVCLPNESFIVIYPNSEPIYVGPHYIFSNGKIINEIKGKTL